MKSRNLNGMLSRMYCYYKTLKMRSHEEKSITLKKTAQ